MSPVQIRAVGRHRRARSSLLPQVAATAAVSGALVLAGASTAQAHTAVRVSVDARPTLRYDASGTAVLAVQKRLGVDATGWFGPQTRAAVAAFQRRHGLDATGVVDDATWSRLSAARSARAADRRQQGASSVRASRDDTRSFAAAVLDAAARLKGQPYRYGATGPDAFDCSGFTGYVFGQVGMRLPRTSQQQRDAFARISRQEAEPGDLMFSHDSSGRVYHVAIYAGDGQIWDSSRPGETVAKRDIWTSNISFARPR